MLSRKLISATNVQQEVAMTYFLLSKLSPGKIFYFRYVFFATLTLTFHAKITQNHSNTVNLSLYLHKDENGM